MPKESVRLSSFLKLSHKFSGMHGYQMLKLSFSLGLWNAGVISLGAFFHSCVKFREGLLCARHCSGWWGILQRQKDNEQVSFRYQIRTENKLSRVRDYTREWVSEGGSNGGVILHRMVRKDLSEEVTFKWRPEGSEGEKPWGYLEKEPSRQKEQKRLRGGSTVFPRK